VIRRFTDVLIEEGILDAQRLGELIAARTDLQEPIEDYLVRVGAIDERTRARALSLMYGVPLIDFQTVSIQPEAVALVPRELALRYKAMPIMLNGAQLVVAMADPADIVAVDDLRATAGREIAIAVASRPQIEDALMRYYGLDEDVRSVVQRIRAADEEEVSVIRLVEAILNRAIADRASDLHIEPLEHRTRVRERIDGVLRETSEIPQELHDAVVARIKIMSNLDIAEKRVPQDGRIAYQIAGQAYDLRVSTYPSVHGEKVVLRILEKSTERFDLEKLGLEPSQLVRLRRLIERPYGMLIVCGPTGSGKTTTLYAALNHLNTPERNIITIEDPVEYQLPGIVQANVNPRAGLTFATGLRAILRQDPDVVLVGEIRDRETAMIAVEAALTGHMVFSTLHANEAAGAPGRLVEMGVEPFLLASALVGVLSQRLVRLLCTECREPVEPDPELLARLRLTPDMLKGRDGVWRTRLPPLPLHRLSGAQRHHGADGGGRRHPTGHHASPADGNPARGSHPQRDGATLPRRLAIGDRWQNQLGRGAARGRQRYRRSLPHQMEGVREHCPTRNRPQRRTSWRKATRSPD
jgi:type IV pilus assembly protein PilB